MKKLKCLRGHDTSTPQCRGKQGQCLVCIRERKRNSYNNDSDFRQEHLVRSRRTTSRMTSTDIRKLNLKRRFGITLQEYEEMFRNQRGLCAICKHSERRLGKDGMPLPLGVDHDHESNLVRQLLCGDCNSAIGLMKEDVLRLQSAIEYLLIHRGR